MNNSKDMIIVIEKEYIEFNGEKVYSPFELEELKKILGEGRFLLYNEEHNVKYQVWDEVGIFGWLNADNTAINCFGICFSAHENNPTSNNFEGKLMIGKKDYKECKWELDSYECNLKYGNFEFSTMIPEMLTMVDEESRDFAERLSTRMEFYYTEPKVKKVKKVKKYALKKLDEPVLEFTNFNFKLAVIQELMYEKELLTPIFDVYEFAEEYTKREIDIDDEGFEPIKEVKKWFKDLQIPKSLANELTVIDMDGGNDIYLQIAPLYDGEDDVFDINKITEEEVKQFPNLKKITLMSSKPKKVVEVFETCGIEVEMF